MMSLSEALGVFADPVGQWVIPVGQTGAQQPPPSAAWSGRLSASGICAECSALVAELPALPQQGVLCVL